MHAKRARKLHTGIAAAVVLLALATPALGATEVIPGHKQRIQNNSHALGLSLGIAGSSGFAYRYYFANSFVQANLLPLVADRGDFLAAMAGLHIAHYMLVWNTTTSRALLPTTTALRVVGGGTMYIKREKDDLGTRTRKTLSAAAGVGFEMGAVMKHGFSVSFDIMLTSLWEDSEFQALVPLPYGAVMYSW